MNDEANSKTDCELSFVVPAHNEEALLGRALDSIRSAAKAASRQYEMIVVDDGSTDRTAQIAREYGCRVVPVQLRQIGAVRNAGAAQAAGQTLVFLDADTLLPEATLAAALRTLEAGAVGGGASLSFDGPTALWAEAILPIGNVLCRSTRLAPGCFLFVRRSVFEELGGFDPHYFAAEEWVLSRALGRRGEFVVLREKSITSGRKGTSRELWRMIVLLSRLLVRGRTVLQQRDGLDIWYAGSNAPAHNRQTAETSTT
jgi:glycosyltransferase involved in cell wall biosynthesis